MSDRLAEIEEKLKDFLYEPSLGGSVQTDVEPDIRYLLERVKKLEAVLTEAKYVITECYSNQKQIPWEAIEALQDARDKCEDAE